MIWVRATLLQRIAEFLIGCSLTFAILYAFPDEYYHRHLISLGNALIGAIYVWGVFYVLFLYPLVVSIVYAVAYYAGIRNSWALALISSGIFLAESALLTIKVVGGEQPIRFWISWGALGVVFFVLNGWALPVRTRERS